MRERKEKEGRQTMPAQRQPAPHLICAASLKQELPRSLSEMKYIRRSSLVPYPRPKDLRVKLS